MLPQPPRIHPKARRRGTLKLRLHVFPNRPAHLALMLLHAQFPLDDDAIGFDEIYRAPSHGAGPVQYAFDVLEDEVVLVRLKVMSVSRVVGKKVKFALARDNLRGRKARCLRRRWALGRLPR